MTSVNDHFGPWLIPESWAWTTIGRITSVVGGKSPRGRDPEHFGGGIAWIKSDDLKDGFVRKSAETLTKVGLTSMGGSVIPRGTICIACNGPASGRLGILQLEAAMNKNVSGILPSSCVVSEYLYHFLDLQRPTLIEATKHRTIPHLSLSVIREVPIPLAPIAEQRLVTREIRLRLAHVRAWRSSLEGVHRELMGFRANVLKTAFEGSITPLEPESPFTQDQPFESADEFLHRIVEMRRNLWGTKRVPAQSSSPGFPFERKRRSNYVSPIEPTTRRGRMRLPIGWTWATVDQLCSWITQGWAVQPPYQPSGFAVLSPRNIQDGFIDLSGVGFVSEDILSSYLQRCSPAMNDILMVRNGLRTGRAVIVGSHGPFAIPMGIMLLRPVGDPQFLLYWVWSPLGQRWIRRRAKNAKPIRLQVTSVRRMPIPFPPEKEQQRIVEEVTRRLARAERLAVLVERLQKLSELLHSKILQRAFEGKLLLEYSDRRHERQRRRTTQSATPIPRQRANGVSGASRL
jgi:type I restriction enzyme, S subunit